MDVRNDSSGGELTRKRRKRNLRRCASFERGKCANCEKLDTDSQDCDMKETTKKKST
jgi:hypothetical protein